MSDFEVLPIGTIQALQDTYKENEKLRAVVKEFANDTDDCVSPRMKEKAIAALKETDDE
jgi:hypothetical protein